MTEVRRVPGKGRGVFATRPYKKGDIIEDAPVVVLSMRAWRAIKKTTFCAYPYEWDKTAAIALGNGSLYNHSAKPNAETTERKRDSVLRFTAVRPIKKGEEILVDYTGGDKDHEVWFRANEGGDQ